MIHNKRRIITFFFDVYIIIHEYGVCKESGSVHVITACRVSLALERLRGRLVMSGLEQRRFHISSRGSVRSFKHIKLHPESKVLFHLRLFSCVHMLVLNRRGADRCAAAGTSPQKKKRQEVAFFYGGDKWRHFFLVNHFPSLIWICFSYFLFFFFFVRLSFLTVCYCNIHFDHKRLKDATLNRYYITITIIIHSSKYRYKKQNSHLVIFFHVFTQMENSSQVINLKQFRSDLGKCITREKTCFTRPCRASVSCCGPSFDLRLPQQQLSSVGALLVLQDRICGQRNN